MAKVFVSYSRQDEVAVTALVADLDRGNLDVWFDKELRGGDAWWTEILEQIRKCEVFLFALSDSALRSKPCRSELGYARELNLPILPVQIGEVSSYRIDPIFSVQGIDYRDASAATGFALMGSIYQHAARRAELPEPLPAPPRIPYEYLQRLGVTIHSSEELAPSVRRQLVFELRAALEEEHELSVRTDIIGLLQTMLSRADVTRARNPPTPTPPPSQPSPSEAQLRAMYVEARAELRAQRYVTAVDLLDNLLSLDPSYRDASALREAAAAQRDTAFTYQQAVSAQDAGDWAAAIRLYTQVLEADPAHRDAAEQLQRCEQAQRINDLTDEAQYHAQLKNLPAVMDVIAELSNLDSAGADAAFRPLDPDTAFEIGVATTDRRSTSTAVRAFRHAAEAGHTEAMVRLGDLLRHSDESGNRDAIHWYTRAADDGNADAMVALGDIARFRDWPDGSEAQRWWSKAAATRQIRQT